MKLAFKQIESFVKNPDPAARVILIYGPDQGLMKERTQTVCKTFVPDLNDPFNVVTLTSAKIVEEPSLFYDEAQAQSLMGGNRLVIIRDGGDALTPYIKDYLDSQPSPETLIVIEAGDCGPRSPLRKLAESAKNAAAVPCYIDDERNLTRIIQDMCGHAGYMIAPDAVAMLSSALVGDRVIARGEIEKLLIYKGLPQGYPGLNVERSQTRMGMIDAADVMACCGDTRDWSLDALIYAIGDGDIRTGHKIIGGLFRDQIAPVALLRTAQNHFWRLYGVQAKMASGLSQPEALKTLNPPLFFKVEDAFKRHLKRWPISVVESALDALAKAEQMVKQSEYDAESITTHCLIQLARYNPGRKAA